MRALAARRTTTPGRIRDGNVLGPQGREEFMNCLDYVAPEIAQAWSHSSSAHDWPLGVETGLENGQPVTVALLPEAIVWVRLGESASVDRVRFDEVTSVDLQIRVEGTGHAVGLIVESRSHASNTFWQTYENRELVQRLYRFVVNQWARYRPFDDEALVDEIEALEAQLSAGQLDATVYFTLVAGMARRAVGEVVSASYPWREEVYIRPPEVARAAPARGPGMSGAQARRTGMALGALAAAAMSMGDE